MSEKTYPWIRRWGEYMGSFDYYIENEIHQARLADAPEDAYRRFPDGTWATITNITNPYVKRALGLE